jgi:RHS repeat-associated protein
MVLSSLFNQVMPEGNIVAYGYDTVNRITDILLKDSAGTTKAKIHYEYDTEGNKKSEKYSGQGTAVKKYLDFEYDELNRLQQITQPDTYYTSFSYDGNGNMTQKNQKVQSSPQKIVTQENAYDHLNRLTDVTQAKTEAEEGTTSYEYDKHGNLTQVTDADEKVTTYQYDDMGRVVTSVATPLPGGTTPVTTRYVYDEAGNLVTKVEGAGTALARIIYYDYDTANRLSEIDYPNDTDVTFTYDETDVTNGLGRLTRMQDQSGTTRYSYDSRGNVTREKRTIDNVDYAVDYAYNANNTLTFKTYRSTAANLRGTAYTIDNATQRPVQAGFCAGCHVGEFWAASNIAYEPFGGVGSMSYNNGQEITITRNQEYQIDELLSGSVLDRDYSYDGMGNITEIDRNSMTDDPEPVYPYSYTDDYSFTAQAAGTIMQIDNGDLTQTHAYYAHNILGDVTVTRQYAIQGELTKELRLTWNDDHRLTEVKDGSNTTLATYTYNGLGQRVKKVAGSVTTIFLYDLQGNIISEMRSDGTYDDYLYLEDQRIAKITSNGESDSVYYFHNDHLGTPIAMTDASGNVVWKAAYKAFGEAQVDPSSTITNNFRFPGQYYDSESGLHYNWHRYYDPAIGRYLSPDPILSKFPYKGRFFYFSVPYLVLNPLRLIPYIYVQNNPLKLMDALGLLTYSPTAGDPVDDPTTLAMLCFEECVGKEVTVSGGREGGHKPGGDSAHDFGQGCDVSKKKNPCINRQTAEKCFNKCFDGYGQEESSHYHFQTCTGEGGATGFATGVK